MTSIDITDLLKLNAKQREDHFMRYARRQPNAPRNSNWSYWIRVGSTTLHDADTYELRLKFERTLNNLRRKYGVRVCQSSK